MKNKTQWITETAVLLALLIVLQWITKPLGQLVTGSFVNATLAISALFGGLGCGLVVASLSPIFACFLGIAPNLITVPVIIVGNIAFVALLVILCKGSWLRQMGGLLLAAGIKFILLYELVIQIVCGLAADMLLAQGLLKTPMLKLLPTTFSWPQLVTALIGGSIALLTVPVLKKALCRNS